MNRNKVKNLAIASVALTAITGMTVAVVKKYKRIKKELEYNEYEDGFEPEEEKNGAITYHKLKTYYKK